MKPTTTTAIKVLIEQAREKIPFGLSFDGNCEGRCDECPEKFMEFLDVNLNDWELRLGKGYIPDLGDVETLARDCKMVYRILQKRELI